MGQYDQAADHYNHAYNLDIHNESALLALRELYSNYTYQFEKSLKVSQKLLEIEPTLERRTMVAEDYIKTGKYKKGRQHAFQALKDTPAQRIKNQSIIRFLILTSYFIVGDSTNGNKELAEFIEYYRELEDFKVDEKEWSFNGLICLIENHGV